MNAFSKFGIRYATLIKFLSDYFSDAYFGHAIIKKPFSPQDWAVKKKDVGSNFTYPSFRPSHCPPSRISNVSAYV